MGSLVDWTSLRKDSEIESIETPQTECQREKRFKSKKDRISQTVGQQKKTVTNIHIPEGQERGKGTEEAGKQ